MDKKFTTLAEYLKEAGYNTAAFVCTPFLRPGSGFEQGFDYYAYLELNSDKINTEVIKFLNNLKNNKPFFVWIHYMGPHAPYKPQEKYFDIFYNDTLYRKNDKELKLKPKDLNPEDPFYLSLSMGYIPPLVFHKGKYNLNYYIACYDAKIRNTDFYIGELLRNIEGNNTIVVLTADHGESLGEHHIYFSHGENIYDEELHIPLIIKGGSFEAGKVVKKTISSVDIVPTILNKVNSIWYSFNKNKFGGINLDKVIEKKGALRKYIYTYFSGAKSNQDIEKGFKYILFNNGREELYRLPDENNNLIAEDSSEIISVRRELRENLKNWLKSYPIPADMNAKKGFFDEEAEIKMLRSLGYAQ